MLRTLLLSVLLASPALALDLPSPVLAELTFQPAEATSWAGGSFVRVDQRLADLPVYGASLKLDYDARGELRGVHGDVIDTGPFSLEPALSPDEAIASAREAVFAEFGSGELWPARAALGVLAFRGTHLVWTVDVGVEEPLGHYQVFVDAHDGTLHSVRPQLWSVEGNVYPTNPLTSDVETVELNITGSALANDYARVLSCSNWDSDTNRCTAKESQAVADGDGDFLFDPNPLSQTDDPFAEVHMFHHLDLISRWFDDRFGFRTDFGFAGQAVEGLVNFSYANAFYGDSDGDGIPEVSFGQSGVADFSYDADVVYHEFSHAVFGQLVETGFGRFDELGRDVGAGGLNEGTADLFSMVLSGDPLVGEYAAGGFISGADAIRDLEEDRHCPTDIYGETHRDGEIWGSFGWNLIESELIGAELTAEIIFGAINTWPSEVNYGVAGRSVIEAAETLLEEGVMDQEQVDFVVETAQRQGLDDCGRVVRLDDGAEPVQGMRGGFRQDGTPFTMPLANQFSLDAPEGAVALNFDVVGLDGTFGLGYRVHVRRGDTILHELVPVGNNGFMFAVPDVYDFIVEGSEVGTVVEMDLTTDPPLEPGATYYFSIASLPTDNLQGFGFADITVGGLVDIVPVEEDPLDDPEDGLSGDGCSSCSAVPMSGLLAPLLLIGLRRRR
jgi:Zn-dependent metalloprotease